MHLPETAMRDAVPEMAGALLAQLRARAPRVHCITNAVAQNFTANALLAAGCVPSMTLSADEIGGFVASAHGLLVNLGTLDAERRAATSIAVAAAHQHKLPWVLDPVFVDRSPGRLAFARNLVARGPRVVRLNHREFEALADTAAKRENVMAYARETRTIVAMSGATDLITDGTRAVGIGNGHMFMAKVTAMGCAGSALVGGFLAVEPDALRAAAAALLMLGVAGELAVRQAQGPGSFAAAILDALNTLDAPTLIAHAKVV
ncbi:hydroxyethylthiazole kinase [Pseudolabrys taiwanensis]|nr:hydroxyethylthiazole kinase [Pseudolabrys taiwanensis]